MPTETFKDSSAATKHRKSTGAGTGGDPAVLHDIIDSITPGTGATNLGKAEDAAHTSGDVGVMTLAVRKDTPTGLGADGDYVPLTTDADGRLYTNTVVSGTVSISGTLAVTGTFWQVTQPVSNAGTFAVQVDGAALTSLELIDNLVRVEDAAHASGDSGVMPLAVRQDTLAALAANGDYIPLSTDAEGRLYTNAQEQVLYLTGQAAQTATVNNILTDPSSATATDALNYRTATVQVASTGTGGTFIFEQSNDNTNWVALPVFNAALVTGVPITTAITATNSSIIYTFPIRARYIRLRIATTITGGSIRAFTRLSPEPWTAAAQLVASNTAANMLVQTSGTTTATLAAATVRAGFVAAAGIWYDDSSAALGAGATFTGTSRDATVTASATAMANAATYAKEVRVGAESDVTGTLWVEFSRDNTNWRRMRSVATAAITGGAFAAEIVFQPSWRYWRVGYTNGAGAQARFTIGSIAVAV